MKEHWPYLEADKGNVHIKYHHLSDSPLTPGTQQQDGPRKKRELSPNTLFRLILLLLAASMLSACAPQVLVFPFTGSILVLGMILGLILFLAGSQHPPLRAEGVYLTSIYFLYMTGYLLPLLMNISLSLEGMPAAYIISLAQGLLSGFILAGTAWLARRYSIAFLNIGYAALFGFLLFFLINFGYYWAWSEIKIISETRVSELSKVYLLDMFLEQVPYLSFLLAPIGVALIWIFDVLFQKRYWSAEKVFRINILGLWSCLLAFILFVIVIRGHKMSIADLDLHLSLSSIKDHYEILSDFRVVLFFISCHDLLVVAFLSVGIITMGARGRLYRLRNAVAISGVAVAILLAFVPFFIGQKSSVDQIVDALGGSYIEKNNYRQDLTLIRPLYPSPSVWKHLLISLSVGGVIAIAINLPGTRPKKDPLTPDMIVYGEVNMSRDTYNIQQAGIAGPNAKAENITFNQIGDPIGKSIDFQVLANELSKLRSAMKMEATDTDHDIAISDVAKAEQAAKAKDASKVAESLKSAGNWALEVATKIGTTIATDAIKNSLGMK